MILKYILSLMCNFIIIIVDIISLNYNNNYIDISSTY